MLFPLGSLVNGLAVVIGGLFGLAFGSKMPEKMRELIFQGLGLCIIVLGLQSALQGIKPLITIIGIVIGSIIGELLQIEYWLTRIGDKVKSLTGSSNPRFTEGLVNGSLLFCIGAMGILASIEEGLRDLRDIAYAKSIIDFFAAMILAASLGLGVIFSGISVFIYQGCFVLMSSFLASFINDSIMLQISATGGILMIAIGFNILKCTQIRIGNMIPALFISPLLSIIF